MPKPVRIKPKTLGAQLTLEMLERLRLTQRDFAQLLGIPRPRLRRVLCGDVEIALALALEIQDYSQGEVPVRTWTQPAASRAGRRCR